MPAERTTERLKRILVLVPWVIANPDATVDEVCERFGITRDELASDVDVLMMCGLPPFGPGDLLEAFIEEEHVQIGMADYLAKPPRLTRSEAIALLVMGRAVAALPGLEEAASLRSALGKLAGAVSPGEAERASELADAVAVELGATGDDLLAELRRAVDERGRFRIELRTPHFAWLVRILLTAGEAATVVDPPELRDAVRGSAARALARYER